MAIYDCFQYFNEDHIVDLRLNILDEKVDYFVISESTKNHQGISKRLNFDINKFKKFQNKIIYIVVENTPPDVKKILESDNEIEKNRKLILNGMARDYFQRENLKKGLVDSLNEDLIIISDLDEIPNLETIDFNLIKNNIVIFEQKMFYYKLNLLYEEFKWFGSKAIKKKNFISPQWLRNIKSRKYSKWRLDTLFSKKKYSNLIYVKNGGWHFTCIRNAADLEKKLLNFAHHHEFEESGLKLNDIQNLIKEKRVMYDHTIDQRDYKWSGKSILKKLDDKLLPDYIHSNLEKFEEWLD